MLFIETSSQMTSFVPSL